MLSKEQQKIFKLNKDDINKIKFFNDNFNLAKVGYDKEVFIPKNNFYDSYFSIYLINLRSK